jgi:hypothetical protein
VESKGAPRPSGVPAIWQNRASAEPPPLKNGAMMNGMDPFAVDDLVVGAVAVSPPHRTKKAQAAPWGCAGAKHI